MPAGRLGTGIWRFVRQQDGAWARERLLIVVLDEYGQVVGTRELPTAALTVAELRKAFKSLPRERAAGFVSILNDPNPTRLPSKTHGAIANRLQKVGNEIGLKLLDHVTFWRGNFHLKTERNRR